MNAYDPLALRDTPYLAFGLLAGVIADRYRRRPIFVSMDLGRFLLLGLLAALVFSATLSFSVLMAIGGVALTSLAVTLSPVRVARHPGTP